jgi:hypothetical protein
MIIFVLYGLVKQPVNSWLYKPDANWKKPNQKKLPCVVAESYCPLPFYGFQCLCIEIQTIKNAKHGK